MYDVLISKEQARQFAYDCFDVIVQNIREQEAKKKESENHQVSPPADTQSEVVEM